MLNIQLENTSEEELTALKAGSLINRRMIAAMNNCHNRTSFLLRELEDLRQTAESDDEAKAFDYNIRMMEQRLATFELAERRLVKLGFVVHEERVQVHTIAGVCRLIDRARAKRSRK